MKRVRERDTLKGGDLEGDAVRGGSETKSPREGVMSPRDGRCVRTLEGRDKGAETHPLPPSCELGCSARRDESCRGRGIELELLL